MKDDLGKEETAREVIRLDISQSVVEKRDGSRGRRIRGTNEAIKRGGALGRKDAIMVKVAKPNQDMRFDLPAIGVATIEVATEARLRVIAIEAGQTLLLEKEPLSPPPRARTSRSSRVRPQGAAVYKPPWAICKSPFLVLFRCAKPRLSINYGEYR